MGKIVSVYEHLGSRTASRNGLSSWTEVPLYSKIRRSASYKYAEDSYMYLGSDSGGGDDDDDDVSLNATPILRVAL
jgi:hypothetical protein